MGKYCFGISNLNCSVLDMVEDVEVCFKIFKFLVEYYILINGFF